MARENEKSAGEKTGGCLCGGVRFAIRGRLRPIVACHCTQCRKWSGHYFAATAAHPENFVLEKEENLRWFRASETAQRGFCGDCGSSLFWRPDSGKYVAVAAGALDDFAPCGGRNDLRLAAHIFAADKGAYYDINENENVAIKPEGDAGIQIP